MFFFIAKIIFNIRNIINKSCLQMFSFCSCEYSLSFQLATVTDLVETKSEPNNSEMFGSSTVANFEILSFALQSDIFFSWKQSYVSTCTSIERSTLYKVSLELSAGNSLMLLTACLKLVGKNLTPYLSHF